MTFLEPSRFLWLVAVPALAALVAAAAWRHRGALRAFATADRLAAVLPARSVARRWSRTLLVLGALSLTLVALADPRAGEREREVPPSDHVSVVVALDVSRSMLADDVSPNRLGRARQYARDLAAALGRQEDAAAVGLIAFAGGVKRVVPVTRNLREFELALQATDVTAVPLGGSNLAGAVEVAARSFVERRPGHQVVVMFTDGENLTGEPIEAARTAFATRGVRFFPVGMGDPTVGSKIPAGNGQFVVHDGKPVESRLDAAVLKEIGEAGGGVYVPAETKRADMGELYRRVIRPRLNAPDEEAAGGANATVKTMIPRFGWFVWPALGLLLVERLIAGWPGRRALATVLALTLTWPAGAQTAEVDEPTRAVDPRTVYNDAVAASQAGDGAAAEAGFARAALRGRGSVEARARYNLGRVAHTAALAALASEPATAITRLEAALREYAVAVAVDPAFGDARANLEAAARLLEELRQQQEQEKQEEEQPQESPPQDQNQNQNQEQNNDQNQDPNQDSQQQENPDDGQAQDDAREPGEGEENAASESDDPDSSSDDRESEGQEGQVDQDGQEGQEGQEGEEPQEGQEGQGGQEGQESQDADDTLAPDATAGSQAPEASEPTGADPAPDPGELQEQPAAGEAAPQSGAAGETGELTAAEAEKLLQRIRDQDLQRRIEQYRRDARNQQRVEKDW